MGRLKMLKPRLATLGSRLKPRPESRQEYDRDRDQQPWRRWYKMARWQALRLATLLRDNFTCTMCGRGGHSHELVADHVDPHRGDEDLFWNGELTTLCASPCHSKHKQRAEQSSW